VSYEKYPDSFLTALAKLGGLIALLRLAIFLNLFNKYSFHKSLINDSKSYDKPTNECETSHDETFIKRSYRQNDIQTMQLMPFNNQNESVFVSPNKENTMMENERDISERFSFENMYRNQEKIKKIDSLEIMVNSLQKEIESLKN
jgi:hypothetical protein